MSENPVAIYQDDNIELEIQLDQQEETIWLTQEQMALLFGKDVRTISEHIKNIYKEYELEETATLRKIRIVRNEGGRDVSRDISHYNLDMILSVGYRVSSLRATRFRQWATRILKTYIVNGYAVNEAHPQNRELLQKLGEVEARLTDHDEKFKLVFEGLRQILTPPEQPGKRIGFQVEE